ncbi:MAG: hypothetical protein NFCOHLIN_03030 [Gammaproteobacteria bacterium]|nr:hypothetical protein [Gammaproteobacteria bacterium]
MYVCICNAVTDHDIRDAVEGGARGLEDLRDRLRVATCCGACEDTANACLSQHVSPGESSHLRTFAKGRASTRVDSVESCIA